MNRMKIKEMSCKTALSPSNLPGLDYTLNPYLGCSHQCLYCYAPNILHLNRKEWETTISVKRNLPLILSRELRQKKPGPIGLSTVTDPYQPIEKMYKVTKYCLDILKNYDFPLCIQTKSKLILRDQNLIEKCQNVEVMISIGTLNDEHRKILEPWSSSIPERLEILRKFSNSAVKKSVFFGPIYPNIKQHDIPGIMDVFLDLNVDEIMIDSLHLKKEIIPRLKKIINENHKFNWVLPQTNLMYKTEKFSKIQKKIHAYGKNKNIIVTNAF